MPDTDLHDRLRWWANGGYGTEAAVELLIRAPAGMPATAAPRLIDRIDAVRRNPDGAVWLDTDALVVEANEGSWSGGERRLLLLAASLDGARFDRSVEPLSSLLSGLDDANVRLVLDAMAHAAGWHERGTSHTVTGDLS
jgi:hypothetical protein